MKKIKIYFVLFAFLALLSNCKHDDGMDTITNETNGQKIPYSTHTFSQDKVNALFVNNSQQLKQFATT